MIKAFVQLNNFSIKIPILALPYNLLLILMNQSNPKVIKLGLNKTKSHQIIEKTYVIYTPKIIKFIYHTSSSNIHHLPLSLQFKESQSIQSSEKKNNKSSNGFKTPKIKLVSRKTTQLEAKSDINYPSVDCLSKSQKNMILLKTKKKNKNIPSSSQNSEVQTVPIQNMLSCDLFGCIQQINKINKDEIFLPSRSLQRVQSRIITLSRQIQIEDQPKQIYPDIPIQPQQEKVNSKEEHLSLSRRNKIFSPLKKASYNRAESVQNRSITNSFSRRKRIFERSQSQRKDYELRNSFIRRNKIFPVKQSKQHLQIQYPKKRSSELMNQSQIPEFALNNWPKQQLNKRENLFEAKEQIIISSIKSMHLKKQGSDS